MQETVYEPIYGNHIGIVINDQDPERRSRLQIFIPHLSNTLYAGWNDKIGSDNLKNITFKTFETGIFSNDIVQKLKNVLPWAEGAVPSFGGGTSGFVNSKIGKAFTALGQAITGPGGVTGYVAEKIAGSATTPLFAQQQADLNSVNFSQSSASQAAATAISNADPASIVSGTNGNGQDYISADANGNPYSVTLEGTYTSDGRQIGDVNTSFRYADGSSLDGMKVPYVAVSDPKLLGKPFAVQLNNNPPIIAIGGDAGAHRWDTSGGNSKVEVSVATLVAAGGGVAQNKSGLLSGTTLSAGDSLKIVPITDGSVPVINSRTATPEQIANIYGNQLNAKDAANLEQLTANAANKTGVGGVAGSQGTGGGDPSPVARQFEPTQEPSDVHAKGFYSRPAVGCKVWVFFHGGDIQRPIYFATVIEPSGSVAAYQPI